MNLSRPSLAYSLSLICLLICIGKQAKCQKLTPGLPGMAPSKWITIEHTMAPGRVYSSSGSDLKTYTQEDLFIKAWIPAVYKPNFALMFAPQYRTEQFEFQSTGENPLNLLSSWNLRSIGVDIRSVARLDSSSFLILNLNVNQSGNLQDQSNAHVPVNYTLTSVYLKKKSLNKEIGFGLIANRSFHRFTVLPVFVFNYNYSKKSGLEITLPKKIAWRHNLSPTDILFVKAEAMSRSYFIVCDDKYEFRRTELDMGVAYNKQITKFVGAEVFTGYRRNINTRLPNEITSVKTSGLVLSLELYIRSPFSKR